MNEDIKIIVTYNDQELVFPAKLLKYVYTYKIEVEINESKVIFERDEERNWRAIIPYEEMDKNKNVNKELLTLIADSIDTTMESR